MKKLVNDLFHAASAFVEGRSKNEAIRIALNYHSSLETILYALQQWVSLLSPFYQFFAHQKKILKIYYSGLAEIAFMDISNFH